MGWVTSVICSKHGQAPRSPARNQSRCCIHKSHVPTGHGDISFKKNQPLVLSLPYCCYILYLVTPLLFPFCSW